MNDRLTSFTQTKLLRTNNIESKLSNTSYTIDPLITLQYVNSIQKLYSYTGKVIYIHNISSYAIAINPRAK